jgi:hypothetical protein
MTLHHISESSVNSMSWGLYEILKQEWINKHPNATSEQYQKAMIAIAKKCGV